MINLTTVIVRFNSVKNLSPGRCEGEKFVLFTLTFSSALGEGGRGDRTGPSSNIQDTRASETHMQERVFNDRKTLVGSVFLMCFDNANQECSNAPWEFSSVGYFDIQVQDHIAMSINVHMYWQSRSIVQNVCKKTTASYITPWFV